ncbi:MAG: transcription-repair coupling factor [Eubacterium sp.]|nr:transcription-repair coupling factor [Eubacterium sp.]
MDAIRVPVSEMKCIESAKADLAGGRTPVTIWGASRNVRPLVMEALRGGAGQVLLVTHDEARADQLYQDYRFYDRNVYIYPAKDVLFYYADVHGNLAARKRLEIIKRIQDREPSVIILTVEGLMDRIPTPDMVQRNSLSLTKGEEIQLTAMQRLLTGMGYEMVPLVEIAGQFSVRGGILDIFPLTEECPVRVELWGDEIESIRAFDASTQRSIEEMDTVEILPATEFVLDDERKTRGIRRIEEEHEKAAKAFKESFHTEQYARLNKAVRDLTEGLENFAGASKIDSLVGYFYPESVSFLDYLPKDTRIFVDDPVRVSEKARVYFEEFRMAMESRLSGGYILPGQADVLFSDAEIMNRLADSADVLFTDFLEQQKVIPSKEQLEFTAKQMTPYGGRLDEMAAELSKYREDGYRILLVSMSKTRAGRFAEALQERDIPAFFSASKNRVLQPREVMVTTGSLESGFLLPDAKLVVLTESEMLRRDKEKTRRQRSCYSGEQISDLRDLHVGDYVVHERHGIGIYRGIEQVETDGRLKDYINIDYADGGKLFIPVDRLSAIGKYADQNAAKPKLNKLGGGEWEKTRKRVRTHVDHMAEELISLYADRQSKQGHVYPPDTVWQKEFEETFPYEETEDQLRAIEDTKRDMESGKIMDRLICGDVGFGKTEVALRAAFKAVQDNRQVAYLVPTTILAQQHFDTFIKRLSGYPVNIRMLSRFCTPKETKETLEGLAKGTVDVVIGTHRLLSKDVSFANLGLLVIDEEQRFGVRHKEKIKQLRKTVDVLTLTATPIPRTLHMSMVGIRDMSLLQEPPVDRRPIQTYVMEYDRELVKEACRRELARKGQVYYVYNRVDDIARIASELTEMLPDARIAFAHGKMTSRELESLMRDFVEQEIDVLVTTTIIETGLDIPNVNTIIIHNADRFGLAQLYQLRGRVGRSGRNAFAFLMYQQNKLIKEEAEKRLSAIREFTELGSGYKISLKDLEIRGAGNVLGSDQSGHMEEVGYDLYVKMLSSAIRKKKGEEEEEDFDTVIELPIDAYIPDPYVRSEYLKLDMYKRIYRIRTAEDADAIRMEMTDRFGELPKQVERLLRVAELKAVAHSCCMTEIKYQDGEVIYLIRNGTRVNADQIPVFLKKRKGMRLVVAKKSGFAIRRSKLIQEEFLDQVTEDIRMIREMLIPGKGGSDPVEAK